MRWNFDATSGVQAGQLCAVAINLGSSGMPVGFTPQIPGYQQLWAGSSPTGFVAIAPPHVIGFGDHQLNVPPGILLLLDEFRIQGLVVDAVNAQGSLPVVPTANAITFAYLPCQVEEDFDSLATGLGVYPVGWADGGGERQWRVHTGPTSSVATGPVGASSAPNYMYCEASNPASPGDTYKLNTATYASAGLSGVAFDLSRVGADIDTLDVLMGDGVHAFGGEQVLTGPAGSPTSAYGAQCVYATDLDGDGDADVLSASGSDNKIAWYENRGFANPLFPPFGSQQVITTSTSGAASVYATDLDGDGDADVLSASFNDAKIAWYENLTVNQSGLPSPGSFGAPQVLTGPIGTLTSADGAASVFAADLDGDGDADVLSASMHDDKIAWYENLTVNLNGPASPGSFGTQQVITTSADGARRVYATDLDGDGDADVLSAVRHDNKVAWYENLAINQNGASSPGSFGAQQVISMSANGANSVYATDLDGDGDPDVLSASLDDNKIAWYENLTVNQNGAAIPGGFGPQQVITTAALAAANVYAADLDGDGDADVLSASLDDDKIAWYENLTVNQNGPSSPGTFGAQQVLTGPIGSPTSADFAMSVYATDLDGDGDADVLSASAGTVVLTNSKVAWYENQGRSFPTLLGSYTGPAPGDWNLETLPLLTPLPGSGKVQFQFVYKRGSGFDGDLAIDNFCLY